MYHLTPVDVTPSRSIQICAKKGMRPSWFKNTRRSGGDNQAVHDRYDFKHRSTQTNDRVLMVSTLPPLEKNVPVPSNLLQQSLPAFHHSKCILRLQPLHSSHMPMSAWRLLMAYCERDYAFCNLIVPHFPDEGGVLMCISQ